MKMTTIILGSLLAAGAGRAADAAQLAPARIYRAPHPPSPAYRYTAKAGTHDAGCSVAIGSANALYYRDYVHVAFDLAKSETYRLTGVTRPACWPDTLPVGGLVVAPEGSAYCSCGLAYQMSFALAPAETGKLPIKKENSQ